MYCKIQDIVKFIRTIHKQIHKIIHKQKLETYVSCWLRLHVFLSSYNFWCWRCCVLSSSRSTCVSRVAAANPGSKNECPHAQDQRKHAQLMPALCLFSVLFTVAAKASTLGFIATKSSSSRCMPSVLFFSKLRSCTMKERPNVLSPCLNSFMSCSRTPLFWSLSAQLQAALVSISCNI